MRRCKHFNRDTWCYRDRVTGKIEYAGSVYCNRNWIVYMWDNLVNGECEACIECPYYEVVEIDPYWKDIFDETNRRLNVQNNNNIQQ